MPISSVPAEPEVKRQIILTLTSTRLRFLSNLFIGLISAVCL
jgi:hypothetical protein